MKYVSDMAETGIYPLVQTVSAEKYFVHVLASQGVSHAICSLGDNQAMRLL